jgi:hypothetical protein
MELEYSTMSSEGSSVGSELSQESTRLEEFHIGGVRLQLPQGLCENKNIFKEFFSHRTWHECFTEQQKQHLKVNNCRSHFCTSSQSAFTLMAYELSYFFLDVIDSYCDLSYDAV